MCWSPTAPMARPAIIREGILKRLGVTTTYYDPLIGGAIAEQFRPNTRAVFLESPGSLSFEMQDIAAIAAVAHAKGATRADGQYLGDAALFTARSTTASISRSRPAPNISAAIPT